MNEDNMCQRVIELDPEVAEIERKERRRKPCDESILKVTILGKKSAGPPPAPVEESRFPVWSLILSRGVEQWRRSPGISGGSP